MFVAPPKSSEEGISKDGPAVRDVRAETASMECRASPDPLFASSWQSPVVSLDRRRVAYYRSLGYIAGLAVRTGVALPSLHLTENWWILVANEESFTEDSIGVGTEWATSNANGAGENASCADPAKQGSPTSMVDDVLAALGRIEAAEPAHQGVLDEVLAEARFVAPLSNGEMCELVPGGKRRKFRQPLRRTCDELACPAHLVVKIEGLDALPTYRLTPRYKTKLKISRNK